MTDWLIDGSEVPTTRNEKLTAKSLELTWTANKSTVNNHLRPLRDFKGKTTTLIESTGKFVTEDTASGSNTYSLTPHTSRTVIHNSGSFFVDSYNDRMTNPDASVFTANATFLYDQSRESTSTFTQSVTGSQWGFSFLAPSTGQIATKRVGVNIEATADEPGIGGHTLQLHLSDSQSRLIAEGPTYLDAVNVREVLDGNNLVEDNSPSSRNSVSITVPGGASTAITSGEYVINGWDLTYINDDFYSANIDIWEA